jgi:hypothetical protein
MVFPDAGHPQPRKDIDAFPQQAIPEYRLCMKRYVHQSS